MYESYFDKLRDECYLRNRTSRTAEAYISSVAHFLKFTGKHHSSIRFFYKSVLGRPWDGDYVPRMRKEFHRPVILTLEEAENLTDTAAEPRNKALTALSILPVCAWVELLILHHPKRKTFCFPSCSLCTA